MTIFSTMVLLAASAAHALGADGGAAAAPRPARPASGVAVVASARPAAQDPTDSLYRAAREAMSREDYRRAAQLFRQVVDRGPEGTRASQALYWQAFALYRVGGTDDLREARRVLTQLRERYPEVARGGDAATLGTRVCSALAQRGDEGCARSIAEQAGAAAGGGTTTVNGRPVASGPGAGPCPGAGDESDDRIMALNALLQMDAANAMPILKKVLARRDACSVGLRRKAVFLVSQKSTEEAADVLLDLVRNDPDREVREQAVFWLSQARSERAVGMLETLIRQSTDESVVDKAIFALSQRREARAGEALREYASRNDAPRALRDKAIFQLGQRRSTENAEFLRALYGRLDDRHLKDRVIFALSQQRGVGNEQWLLDLALDTKEPIELRKQALFWAGQSGASAERIGALYDRATDRALREQVIFVLSQSRQREAVDKMIAIARTDRDTELRKKAIFWLGQSRDPRAAAFLQELLEK